MPQIAPVPEEVGRDAPPKATVVVVLGFGPAEPCAEQLAQDAVSAIRAGTDPLRVTAALLEGVRSARWPRAAGTFSALLRGSDGRFGGIQRAPAGSLTAEALVASLSRQALLDGARLRTALAPHPSRAKPVRVCAAHARDSLDAAAGVLIRTEAGFFWGGVVTPDLPMDAGVLSVLTQYGVSVAAGPAGGVLLITDCSTPPAESTAERIYASSDWLAAAAEPVDTGACRVGHALLTAERAWVQSSSPLAWAALEQKAGAEPPALTPPRADAGAQPPPSPGAP